jgi:hypothetical protein
VGDYQGRARVLLCRLGRQETTRKDKLRYPEQLRKFREQTTFSLGKKHSKMMVSHGIHAHNSKSSRGVLTQKICVPRVFMHNLNSHWGLNLWFHTLGVRESVNKYGPGSPPGDQGINQSREKMCVKELYVCVISHSSGHS